MKNPKVEDGSASFHADLTDGTLTIKHGSSGRILHKVKNVKKGSWDKIWETILSIKSVK